MGYKLTSAFNSPNEEPVKLITRNKRAQSASIGFRINLEQEEIDKLHKHNVDGDTLSEKFTNLAAQLLENWLKAA